MKALIQLIALSVTATLAVLSAEAHASGGCAALGLTGKLKADQKVITVGTDFMITNASGDKVGLIEERVLKWTTTFELMDPTTKRRAAWAKERFFAWGTTLDIFDCNDKLIGTVSEKILQSLFKVTTEYTITDANGKSLGLSNKEDFIWTTFEIRDAQYGLAATMKRKLLTFMSDVWNITIAADSKIDPRLMVFLPAFKTARDDARKAEAASEVVDELLSDDN